MIIAFPFAFRGGPGIHGDLARVFVDAIKGRDRSARVIQLSDEETPEIEGVHECYRSRNEEFGRWYFEAMMAFPATQFLRLDVDVLVRKVPHDVFEHPFDVAVAKERKGTLSNGVVFVKDKGFFAHCMDAYLLHTRRDGWNDIQVATQIVIDSGLFRVRKLDPNLYNFMPERRGDYREAQLVHFEGSARKEWMLGEH